MHNLAGAHRVPHDWTRASSMREVLDATAEKAWDYCNRQASNWSSEGSGI